MSLTKAKQLLLTGQYTCVLVSKDNILTSSHRGVRPLVEWLRSDTPVRGCSAADKVVGRATAFLYVLLGVRELYATVISRPALEVLSSYDIPTEYGKCVDNIINRAGDGICPFEEAVMSISDPNAAYTAITEKMRSMNLIGEAMKHGFDKIKKNFGFGCMRLPMKDGEVDYVQTKEMFDAFIEAGFNYFDTAHGYIDGKSEIAVCECLTSRYPREAYVLTNKLSTYHFKTEDEIRPLFESQLKICGVDYFDFYLMHAQDKTLFEKYKQCRAYETALEFLAEGRIKHLGISFHDTADVLDRILTEYPQVEIVQIQLNYVDFDDPSVQSAKCLEVCRKHDKPAIVMEPVKGGSLVKLPDEAQAVFDSLNSGSNAEYAIRFAAGQEGVIMVLSGMGNMDMVRDNIGYMKDFKPLDERESAAVSKVCEIFRSQGSIPCTACRYCTEVCPKGIPIPETFACLNSKKVFNDWNAAFYYNHIHTKNAAKASDCIRCGLCEGVCPQHLSIRELLAEAVDTFEKKDEK